MNQDSNKSQIGIEEKQAFLSKAARDKLINFCEIVNPKWETVWFHELLANTLEDAVLKVRRKEKVRIILTLPPRHGKSQLSSIYFPAWALGKYPDLKVILATYGAELSEKMGLATRDVISSEIYQAIFPGINLRQDQKAKAKWMTNKNGSYTAVGAGAGITGSGCDILVCDDLVKSRDEAESETMQKFVWDYYRSTLYSRLEGYGAVIVIMQRWSNRDVVAKLLEEEQKMKDAGKEGEGWTIINFPAIAEKDEIIDGKLIRKEGDPLWPAKFPLEVLNNIKNTSGLYNWCCTPAETPILMADWTYKKISEIVPGDKIVGFNRGTPKKRATLCITTVKNTFSKIGDVYDLTMNSGRKVRCTKDHKWYTKRKDGFDGTSMRRSYEPVKEGGSLFFVCPIDEEVSSLQDIKDWNYLAGIVDGEGHVGANTLSLTQSIEKNVLIYEQIKNVLKRLNLSSKEYIRKTDNPKWQDTSIIQLHDCKDVYRKLIKYTDFAKKDQAIKRIYEKNHMFIRERDKVIKMTFSKTEPVYALETETGNYIAWGYASSNSQYQQDPIATEAQEFKEFYFRYFEEQDLTHKRLRYYTLVDPAISQKTSADNTVVLTIAKEVDGPNIYRIREDAGHFTPEQTLQLIFAHQADYRSEVAIEVVQYQMALKYSVIEEQRKRQIYFTVHEIKSSTNKESRIRGLLPLYSAGVIFHRKGDIEYERELLSFPRGKRDDRIDAMSMWLLLDINTSSGTVKQFKPHWTGYGRKK